MVLVKPSQSVYGMIEIECFGMRWNTRTLMKMGVVGVSMRHVWL